MDEPLLSPSDRRASSSGAPAAAAPSSPSSRQLIPHAPFSLDAFVRFVLASWAALLHGLSACLRALLGAAGAAGAPRLSLVQAQRLEDLQAKLAEPYDPACAAHREQLRELWRLAFPGEPLPASAAAADASSPSSLASPRWRDAGFQGDDPRTDFRGAGLAGLDHLLYLGTRHPALFEALLRKTRGARSSWEYPFACAGLNLTFTLADVLGLGAHAAGAGGGGAAAAAAAPPPGALPATPAGRAFLALLAESDAAFEELYCAAFDRLDRLWLERRASYMEFNSVLKQLRGEVDAALRARPATLAALRAALLSNGGGGGGGGGSVSAGAGAGARSGRAAPAVAAPRPQQQQPPQPQQQQQPPRPQQQQQRQPQQQPPRPQQQQRRAATNEDKLQSLVGLAEKHGFTVSQASVLGPGTTADTLMAMMARGSGVSVGEFEGMLASGEARVTSYWRAP